MKRSKKVFNREVAYNAYCYYMQHESANYSDTACFISKLFNTKYTKDDIGKIFRHIVIFGSIDENAKKLCRTVNRRSRYDKDFYNRFLGYRYAYPDLIKELSRYEDIVYEKNQLQFLISEYDSYSNSELEQDCYFESIQRKYKDICSSFGLLDFNYICRLKERIETIEKHRIKELLI